MRHFWNFENKTVLYLKQIFNILGLYDWFDWGMHIMVVIAISMVQSQSCELLIVKPKINYFIQIWSHRLIYQIMSRCIFLILELISGGSTFRWTEVKFLWVKDEFNTRTTGLFSCAVNFDIQISDPTDFNKNIFRHKNVS